MTEQLSINQDDRDSALEAIDQAEAAYKRLKAELNKDEPNLRKVRSFLGLVKTFNTEAEGTVKDSIPVRKRTIAEKK